MGVTMGETAVTMTELKQRLGDIINRVAYGGDRVVLLFYGRPKAAIVSLEDLEQLRQGQKAENCEPACGIQDEPADNFADLC